MRDVSTTPSPLLERLDQGRVKFELLGNPEVLGRLGRFIVFARVGAGGMGVIYHAYDPELDRGVAIKLLHPAITARGGHRRLQREARAMARLAHPNVVQVFEVGASGDQVFLVMEFVAGQTLRAWLSAAPRSWQAALAMFRQAADGLIASHAHGLVHCDFKPENVLIDADGRVRVGDFGLVQTEVDERGPPAVEQLRARASLPDAASTSASRPGGTPRYMAPEQLAGRAADPRSDQFSFCVALYEALAPAQFAAYVRDESVATRALRGERPPPLVVPGAPPGLALALARGLDPEPTRRWPALVDLQAALARVAAPPTRGWRWGLGAGLALGLVGGVGYGVAAGDAPGCDGGAAQLTAIWDAPRRARLQAAVVATGLGFAAEAGPRLETGLDEHARAWQAAHRGACEAHQRGEMSAVLLDRSMLCLRSDLAAFVGLIQRLQAIDPAELARAMDAVLGLPDPTRCGDHGRLLAEVAPPDDPATAAAAREVEAQLAAERAEWQLGKLEVASRLAEEALTRAEQLGHPPLLVQALYNTGKLQHSRDQRRAAEASLTRATFLAAEIGDDERLGLAAAALADVIVQTGDRWAEARLWVQLSRAITGRTAPRGQPHFEALFVSGQIEYAAERHAEAGEWYAQALALAEAAIGPTSGAALRAGDMLALTLGQRGELAAALARFERSAPIHLQVYGPGHPLVATHHNNYATLLLQAGRIDEALAEFEQVLAMWQAAYGPDHPDVGISHGNIASALLTRARPGDLEAAEPHLLRSIAAQEANFGPHNPDLAIALANLGYLQLFRVRLDEAEASFARAIAIGQRSLGAEHTSVVPALAGLADAAALRGDLVVAADLRGRVLAIQEASLGPDHPDLAWTLWPLAETAIRAGDLELAARHLARVDRLDLGSLGEDGVYAGLAARGRLARARGDHETACDHLARSLRGESDRTFDPAAADLTAELAHALAAAGRADEARPLAERAAALFERGGPALAWRVDELAALRHRSADEQRVYSPDGRADRLGARGGLASAPARGR